MSGLRQSEILAVHHWTDRLFSFTATRDPGFRFVNGQFVMIGLPVEGKPLLRAYSVVSPNYAETLEFLSIKVSDGPLTSRLRRVSPGDPLYVGLKASGTLLTDNLRPGRRLYLVSTGTGLAPFMSIVRDPDVYGLYEQIILIHNVRTVDELAYRGLLEADLQNDEWLGEAVTEKLTYLPIVSRAPFDQQGRVTDWMRDGRLASHLGVPVPSRADDRFMVCGSPAMLADFCAIMAEWGFREGSSHTPGDFVIERAFVEK